MSEQSIVVRDEFLTPKYISEDDIPRDGGRWPEYCNTMIISIDSFENRLASGSLYNFYFEDDAPLSKQPPFYSIETLRAAKGELANFYIRVYSRQHASMQGVLVNAKNNDTYAFRSGLELIRVLHELLGEAK